MVEILGIGGFFFRAHDPAALGQWYFDNFGINKVASSYNAPVWQQAAGATAFAPFPHDTQYFGRAEQGWMLNFRVADLDTAIDALRERGIDVELDPETYPNGRFARLYDPEGNPIELWEPLPE